MSNVSSQLLWEVLRNHSCFLKKGLNNVVLTSEPGNLYQKNSYKYSGLARDKTVSLEDSSAEDQGKGVQISLIKKKKGSKNKPNVSTVTKVLKKDPRRMSKAVRAEVEHYRPDLVKAALGRLGAECKQLKLKRGAPKS